MNLGGVVRTDMVLDEIGGRRQCAAAADDEILAALAAWVDQIDDVPVAKRRGRHRAARSGGLQRILGGGAVVLASLSGASVAAAVTGADVPGLSSFGRAVVGMVPGDQFRAQQPEEGKVVEAVPAPGDAGTPARQVAVPAGATGSSGADRTGVAGRGTSVADPRSARASAPGGLERALTGDEGPPLLGDGLGQGQDGGATDASPDRSSGQTGTPEHAMKDRVPGREEKAQAAPGGEAQQAGPPEHAMKDRVRGPGMQGQVALRKVQQTGPPEHAMKDRVPGQETDPTVPGGQGVRDSLPQGRRGEAVAAGVEDLLTEVRVAPAAPGLAPPVVEAQTRTP